MTDQIRSMAVVCFGLGDMDEKYAEYEEFEVVEIAERLRQESIFRFRSASGVAEQTPNAHIRSLLVDGAATMLSGYWCWTEAWER
jgi:hypothetical protein